MSTGDQVTGYYDINGIWTGDPIPMLGPYHDPFFTQPYVPPPKPMGCICPGDATPFCQNPMCPRKNPFDTTPKAV